MQLDDAVATNGAVRTWEGVHLLHSDESSCSQKVRILLNEKKVAWQSHRIDLRKREHMTPEFLSINPRGVVPVLVHDGAVHVESNDLLEYVDELPSDRASFFPRRANARAHVKEELAYQASLRLSTRALTVKFMAPRAISLKSHMALDDYRNNGAPDLSRDIEIAWWQRATQNGLSHDSLVDSFVSHREALTKLEYALWDREWLYGNRISVLDIAWFTTIHHLRILGYNLSRHPYLLSYYQRLLMRPAFREETQIKGPLRLVVPAYRLFRHMTGNRLEGLAAR